MDKIKEFKQSQEVFDKIFQIIVDNPDNRFTQTARIIDFVEEYFKEGEKQ